MTTTEGDCESLQRFEGLAVAKLGTLPGWDSDRVCASLKGWKIELHPKDRRCTHGGWLLFEGFCAAGYTHIDTKTIELASTDWRPSALAHEMCHVMDYKKLGHDGHCLWNERRRSVLTYLMQHDDYTRPEATCFLEDDSE